jgi:hypothetical protein
LNPLDIKDFTVILFTRIFRSYEVANLICLFHSGTQLLGAPWVKNCIIDLVECFHAFQELPFKHFPILKDDIPDTLERASRATRCLIWKSVFQLGFEPRTRQLKGHPLYPLSYRNNCLIETVCYRRDSNPRKFISNEILL